MFGTLATEIFEYILGFLEDKSDLCAVRLVCRQFRSRSTPIFGHAFFSVIKSDLSKWSFDKLESIAQHVTFRHFVCHLYIGPRSPIKSLGHRLGRGYNFMRENTNSLDATSAISATLHDWLATKLVNCRSIEVTDAYSEGWDGWGPLDHLTATNAVHVLLVACIGVPIQSFRINQHRRVPAILYPGQISPDIIRSPRFQDTWASHLQELELSWKLQMDTILEFALDLIVAAKSLRTLCVNWHSSSAAETFFEKLGQMEGLPRISDLRIDKQRHISQNTLLAVLSRLGDSLKSLSFWWIELDIGQWKSLLAELPSKVPLLEQVVILECFEDLAPAQQVLFCPLLRSPRVEDYSEFEFVKFRFKRKERATGVRYRGKGMTFALSYIHDSIYLMNLKGQQADFIPGQDGLLAPDRMRFWSSTKKFNI